MADLFNKNVSADLATSPRAAEGYGRASRRQRDEESVEGQLTVDVFDGGDDIVVRSTVAGVDEKNLDISVTSDMITIKGFREPDQKVRSAEYYHQELYWGPFSRSIILPVDVDADAARASLKNGILTIRLPKMESRRTKKVFVRG